LVTKLCRLVGLILLLFGLWADIKVMAEAFNLYADPVKIETSAQAIKKGSYIDRTFSPVVDEQDSVQQDFRMPYFAA